MKQAKNLLSETDVVELEQGDDTIAQAPKKRGRPRKEPTASIVQESEEGLLIEQQEPEESSSADATTDVFVEPKNEQGEQSVSPEVMRRKVTVHYGDEDLEIFRKTVLDARKEAIEEFQILREHLEEISSSEMADENASYSMHMAEQGSEAQEKEKIYAQVQRLNDYIRKLDDALQRIDEKTYGICRMCGCLIAKARLLAVPITTLSASYKIHKKCPDDGIDRIFAIGGSHQE